MSYYHKHPKLYEHIIYSQYKYLNTTLTTLCLYVHYIYTTTLDMSYYHKHPKLYEHIIDYGGQEGSIEFQTRWNFKKTQSCFHRIQSQFFKVILKLLIAVMFSSNSFLFPLKLILIFPSQSRTFDLSPVFIKVGLELLFSILFSAMSVAFLSKSIPNLVSQSCFCQSKSLFLKILSRVFVTVSLELFISVAFSSKLVSNFLSQSRFRQSIPNL